MEAERSTGFGTALLLILLVIGVETFSVLVFGLVFEGETTRVAPLISSLRIFDRVSFSPPSSGSTELRLLVCTARSLARLACDDNCSWLKAVRRSIALTYILVFVVLQLAVFQVIPL